MSAETLNEVIQSSRLFYIPLVRLELAAMRMAPAALRAPIPQGEEWREDADAPADGEQALAEAEHQMRTSIEKVNAYADSLAKSGLRVSISKLCPGIAMVEGFSAGPGDSDDDE